MRAAWPRILEHFISMTHWKIAALLGENALRVAGTDCGSKRFALARTADVGKSIEPLMFKRASDSKRRVRRAPRKIDARRVEHIAQSAHPP